jgi:hypothetical protein
MTKRERARRKRRAEIIKTMSDMSKDWSRWTAADWQPLEDELKQLALPNPFMETVKGYSHK